MKYFSSIIALLFIGCVGSEEPQAISYPSWYLNPPQNDGSSLYGVGDGRDINTAKTSALNSIAASLSITVSSEFKKSESTQSFNGNESAYHSALNTIKAQVKEIEFSDYQVIQNQATSTKALVLVEVSRAKLFQKQKEKLERFSTELAAEQKNIARQSSLQKAFMYSNQVQKAQKLNSLALLTKTINANFNVEPFLQQVAKTKQVHNDSINNTRVYVSADKEAKVFIDVLKEGLNKAGLKVVRNNENASIHIKNSFQTDEIYGFKIAKASISFSSKDAKNKTIATRSIKLSGKSRYDYDKAKANAAQVLGQQIEQEGIYTLLGIK
ncbi:LPP20 family lipoprotein [Campylobacterota bacterium]